MVEDAVSGAEIAPRLLTLAVFRLLLCLQHGQGPVCSRLSLLWYSLKPLFCDQVRLCLGTLHRNVLSLSLFYFPLSFSLSLAIPQFGLLSHISSLRLSSGHSGPVLTLSNADCTSLFSPDLLVADTSIMATSLLGVAVRHVICWFYLFMFFLPVYVAL